MSMEPAPLIGLRIMYGAAVIGAGAVGAMTLFAPVAAERYIFADATEVDIFLRVLGAVWLATGVVAIGGLADPLRYLPVLLIQLLYKTAWLVLAAFPALASGSSSRGLVFLTVLFIVWVLALILVIPFRVLLPSAL